MYLINRSLFYLKWNWKITSNASLFYCLCLVRKKIHSRFLNHLILQNLFEFSTAESVLIPCYKSEIFNIAKWLILRRKYTNFFRIRLLNFIFTTPIIRYKLIHLKRVQTITNKSYIFQDTCVILQKTVVMLSWTMITMLGVQLLFIESVTNVIFMATLSWTGFVPWNFVIRLEVLSHWHALKVLKKMITWRIG